MTGMECRAVLLFFQNFESRQFLLENDILPDNICFKKQSYEEEIRK